MLGEAKSPPALLQCLQALAVRTETLLNESKSLGAEVKDFRLGLEIAVIQAFADKIVGMLKVRDPLSERVHLSTLELLGQSIGGIAGEMTQPRRRTPSRVKTGGRRMTLQTAAANADYGTTASGSSFYAAMRILPRSQREAMFQIYSFCRQVDDIADSDGPRPERLAALQQWRDDIDALYQGTSAAAPAGLRRLGEDLRPQARGFSRHRRRHGNGRAAGHPRAGSWRRSISIATASPAPVGRLSVRVFGLPEEDGILLAHHLGRALQLTNILRDIDEDAGLGRLYLPREGLLLAGITSDDPQKVIADRALAKAVPAAGRAGEDAFREGRRDHEAQFAARGARAADHVEILPRDPGSVAGAGFCRSARAGPRHTRLAKIAILLRYAII